MNYKDRKKFYKSKSWQQARSDALIRDGYTCQECLKKGVLRNRYTINRKTGKPFKIDVHHIKELEFNPELALNQCNLETVCVDCHNILDNRRYDLKEAKIEELW